MATSLMSGDVQGGQANVMSCKDRALCRLTSTVSPPPDSLRAAMLPPCICTARAAMAKPRPKPTLAYPIRTPENADKQVFQFSMGQTF